MMRVFPALTVDAGSGKIERYLRPARGRFEPTATQAGPGGGPGKVWVNTASHVYRCANDQWYGKTKQGEYMSEADAIAKGNRASHGKPCS